ncbi:hypothetical protein A4A49_57419 [Nicotiana attenuata]|uniref:Myb/SANT-like domain-containing protein n=1 Tax=Nicotiana attenuata TaxID=49451 RepID=A0A1J6IFP5_NICAT|nr:hypothetical protein A4A49_57419 [Nicotiana attenuata]
MKGEWTLFKQLMRGETGLGWDATKNTIMADDDWWERKIKENAKYKKFRNKDLSLIWFRYDALFADVVATGERARAANQEQSSGIGLNLDEEGINVIDDCDKEHFTYLNDEMSDESDDLQNINSVVFPEPSLKRQKSTDGVSSSSQVRKSKKKTAATLIKEDIHSLIEFMSSKSTGTSPAVDETSIEKCIGTNIVERTFGVWKARWSILRDMPFYHIDTQRDVVLATMAIHNYIRKKCNMDDAFRAAENERYVPSVDPDVGTSLRANNNINAENVEEQSDLVWMGLRDLIANEICEA